MPCQIGDVFMTWQWLPSEGVMRDKDTERTQSIEATAYYNLTLKVTSLPYPILTQTNPGTVWEGTMQGCQYQEVGLTGDHFGGLLSLLILT